MEKITLRTTDNVEIVGNYFTVQSEKAPAVILLHMMPATKESWNKFAPKLVERGFQVLAIDERGHGESIKQADKTLDYREFTDTEQQSKLLDVDATQQFFLGNGVQPHDIFIGGGSVGANLTIQYMAEHSEIIAGFAISPGYNYRGIETKPLMEHLRDGQNLYLIAAEDDPNVVNAAEVAKELEQIGPANKEIKIFDTGGHGENIFSAHPDFMGELADWLARFIR